jgi:hypothetical protein
MLYPATEAAITTALRDREIANDPGSPPHRPVLAEVRAILSSLLTAARLQVVISVAAPPPVSPAIGDRHLVAATGLTGAFVGRGGQIAEWSSTGWLFAAPAPGDRVFVLATSQTAQFSAGAWSFGAPLLANQDTPDVQIGPNANGISYFEGIAALGFIVANVMRLAVYNGAMIYRPDGVAIAFSATATNAQMPPDVISLGADSGPEPQFNLKFRDTAPLQNAGDDRPVGVIAGTRATHPTLPNSIAYQAGGWGAQRISHRFTTYGASLTAYERVRITGGDDLGAVEVVNARFAIGKAAPGAPAVVAISQADGVDAPWLTLRNMASGYGSWGFRKKNSNDLQIACGSGSNDTPATPVMTMAFGGAGAARLGVITETPAVTFDVAGGVAHRVVDVVLANGLNSNIALPNAAVIRIVGPTAAFEVGGLTGGADGRLVKLLNASTGTMTIKHADSGSSTGNQINCLAGASIPLPAGSSYADLIYDSVLGFWLPTSRGQ